MGRIIEPKWDGTPLPVEPDLSSPYDPPDYNLEPDGPTFPREEIIRLLRAGRRWSQASVEAGSTYAAFKRRLRTDADFVRSMARIEGERHPEDKAEARRRVLAIYEGPPGPRADLRPQEVVKVLDAMRGGRTRKQACRALRIAYKRFVRETMDDPDFALAAETIEWAAGRCYDDDDGPGPGRPALPIEPALAVKLVELVRTGLGRKTACLKLEVGYGRFVRQMRDDPEFASCVRTAEAAREESCERRLLELAEDAASPAALQLRAATAYLGRRERAASARRSRRKKGGDDVRPVEDACSVPEPARPPAPTGPPAGIEIMAPEAAATRRRRPEPPADPAVKSGIVADLRSGHGRRAACIKAGLSYGRFLRLLRSDEGFAERVLMVESAREEACELILYRLSSAKVAPALRLRATVAYLARRDRQAESRRRAA